MNGCMISWKNQSQLYELISDTHCCNQRYYGYVKGSRNIYQWQEIEAYSTNVHDNNNNNKSKNCGDWKHCALGVSKRKTNLPKQKENKFEFEINVIDNDDKRIDNLMKRFILQNGFHYLLFLEYNNCDCVPYPTNSDACWNEC